MKKLKIKKILKLILLLTLLMSFEGCKDLQLVSQAQDDFNEAATYQNSMKFSPEQFELIQIGPSYGSAYSKINEALKKEEQLKKDGLLGTALTIKALCEWKLKKNEKAMATQQLALKELSGQPRDIVIMKALPGLIKTDQANNKLTESYRNEGTDLFIDLNAYTSIKSSVDSALNDFESAISGNTGHPIVSYIEMSRVSSIVILFRASSVLVDGSGATVRKSVREKYVKPELEELEKLLGEKSSIYKYYKGILAQ